MEDWNKKLITAASDGDIEALKLSLQNGANIDYQTERGETALMEAAWWGQLVICRYLIDRGCKIDTTTGSGETAVMQAAYRGHLEICKLLIDTGCKIDTTSGIGRTALMMAAVFGHLEVCRFLIDTGCKIDITDSSGRTALHLAAEEGHLKITRYLVERGASPLVTTYKDKTPNNLAAGAKKGQYEEVMKYLQTVMSEKSSGVTAELGKEDEMVPTEIKLMADKRSIDLYLQLLESGSEKKRDIRLVVVGKKGTGKTSLIRRLFGEDITDVNSTNGITIHKIKCKAMSDDGIWNKLDGTNEETEIHARLLKPFKETIEASVDKGAHEAVKVKTPSTSFDESETVTQHKKRKIQVTTESQVEPLATSQQPNLSFELAKRDIEAMLKWNVDFNDKEEFAKLVLWDFAGDEEFYHTHQTFLSPDAIYLVVTNLNEAGDKQAQALFQLWMDSIHCYSRLEEDRNKSDINKKTSDDRDPPVVIVGTWKDALISDVEEINVACNERILKYTENMSEDQLMHIRQTYFISNTEDDPSVFQQIRENILTLARKMKTWNIRHPLKFIQLEKRLQEKKKGLPIISFQEIQNIANGIPKPINDEELRLFLEFHHEMRTFVYFKDLPSYIILDTRWFSDAFRYIVTAKRSRAISIKNRQKWDEWSSRGKLHSEVLEDIFRTGDSVFSEHKNHILNVMERFDIIIRSNMTETADEKPCYYVPCLIKLESHCDIYETFNVTDYSCKKSTWLCYIFTFKPPHLMNHLIASLSRKYDIAEVVVPNQKKKSVALYGGIAVFELQKKTYLRKLLVMTFPHCIQVQVLEFGKDSFIKRGLYKDIGDFVTDELEKIIHTRFQMSTAEFEKKFECGRTPPEFVTGSNEFSEEQITEYLCGRCKITHTFDGEWSEIESKALSSLKNSEAASGIKSDTESIILTEIVSTKEPMCPDTKLDFSDILDQMMTKLVISVDDRRSIEQNDDQKKKLFNIMIDRGEPNKSVCIDVLKQNTGYEDLTEKLSGSPSSVPPPTKTDLEDVPDYKIRLQKNYLAIINKLKHNT